MNHDQVLTAALNWYRQQTRQAGPVIPRVVSSSPEANSWVVRLESKEGNISMMVEVSEQGVRQLNPASQVQPP